MALFPNFKAKINFIFWKYLVKFKFKEQRMKSSRIVGQRVVLIFKFILLFWQTSVSLMFWNSNYITVLSEIHNGLYCVDDHCERDQSDGQGHGSFVLFFINLWIKKRTSILTVRHHVFRKYVSSNQTRPFLGGCSQT